MKSSIRNAALTAIATLIFTSPVSATLSTAVYEGCYSSSYPLWTNETLRSYIYQSSGWCQEQCGTYAQTAVFGLTDGSGCWCGDKIPANSTKVSDDECNVACNGYGTQSCGGTDTWSVYTTGLTTSVDSVSDAEASSAAASTATSSTTATSSSGTHTSSTVSGDASTIFITATPTGSQSSATSAASSKSSDGGASKAGIAAGVVVGVVAIAAIAAGSFFYVRYRKRKAIEEEHQRQQTINSFKSGTIKSERSATDSRLDPAIQYRRQSDGSIADETDFSRRVLKVTNPDRLA